MLALCHFELVEHRLCKFFGIKNRQGDKSHGSICFGLGNLVCWCTASYLTLLESLRKTEGDSTLCFPANRRGHN